MSSRLFTDVKRFMDYIQKRSYALQFINTIILIAICFYFGYKNHILETKIDNLEKSISKKVDHRYFNMTRSLEDIHNVRIDTLNGSKRP